jgi:hypothetical protein
MQFGYGAGMIVGAVELGWIVGIGFATLFAGELALSAYISKLGDRRLRDTDR